MNERQQRFCDEYLIDCNAVQAAIRAGYSPKTARFAAEWINERNPQKPTSKFNAEMKAYIDAKLEAMHNAKTADAQEVLEYLTSVMRGEHKEQVLLLGERHRRKTHRQARSRIFARYGFDAVRRYQSAYA